MWRRRAKQSHETEQPREEKRRGIPAVEVPTGVVELAIHGVYEHVSCIVPIPDGDCVAIASTSGKVRVYVVPTGALEHEIDAHEGEIAWRALAALGGDILVSGEFDDGKVVAWNVAGGERLDEAAAGSGVFAVATIDGGAFVAGTRSGVRGGDVVFYTHHGGRGMTEAPRIAHAHIGSVLDFSVCGGLLATVCVTQFSSGAVVAHTQWSYLVNGAAVLLDGRHIVSGWIGSALVDAPVHILRAHGAAAFPEAAAAASALAAAEPLPPLHDAAVARCRRARLRWRQR